MTGAPTIARDAEPNSHDRQTGRLASLLGARPLHLALLIVVVTIVVRAQGSVDPDVAWQLWIGRQLNHGAHLYRDIVETNPPLWFWMAMPVDRLSELIHVRSDHVLIILTGCCAVLALTATDRLIRFMDPLRGATILAYSALILIAMPWVEFGQREHLVLIGAVPYVALIAARRSSRPITPGLAIAIGVGAALGFALKHYFLIVPVLLEAWLVAGRRTKWRPIRPETAAMICVGLLYALAMLIAAHDYFTVVVPMLLLAYGATGAKHLVDLFQPAVLTALVSIVLVASNHRFLRSEVSGIAAAFTVAAIGFTVSYFVQAKGWSYHAVPMLGCSALALAALLAAGTGPPRLAMLIGPALLCLPFTIALQNARREPASVQQIAHAVQGMPAGDSIGFLSADPSFGWYVTLQQGFRFPLRYNGLWMLQAIVSNEGSRTPDPRLTQLGHQIVRETVADFECTPPRRIVIARPTPKAVRAGEFDILAFFLREPQFGRLLAHYRPISRTTNVEVLKLAVPLDRPANCPSWSAA